MGSKIIEDAKAVPAFAAGSFYERPVAEPLAASFSSIWVHRMPLSGALPIVIMPDATIDLQWIDGTLRVAGPDKDPQTEFLAAGATVIGFRFRPGAAAAWLGIPAIELLGQRLALEELWGAKARRVAGAEPAPDDLGAFTATLERLIAQIAGSQRPVDTQMQAAHGLIESGPPPGAPLIPWLGRALAMSERTLRRRFDENFGYGPKTLDRILRYQRFLRLARQPHASAAILAVEAGYSDQAHLVRESRRLSGSTPHQFKALLRTER